MLQLVLVNQWVLVVKLFCGVHGVYIKVMEDTRELRSTLCILHRVVSPILRFHVRATKGPAR